MRREFGWLGLGGKEVGLVGVGYNGQAGRR